MKVQNFLRGAALLLLIPSVPCAGGAGEEEIRGFWIEAWSNGIKTPSQVDQVIADARAGNFNAIIPQVRRRGDTLYFSDIEPRVEDATVPADFDALAYLIERARAEEPPIEVHAWIVAYPIWRPENQMPQDPQHVVNRHPEWLSQSFSGEIYDGNNYQHDPGHPGVQQHLLDVCMELITKYDVDGLHFDYIRLTGRQWGYNPVGVERFQRIHNRTDIPEPNDGAWKQFRRDQITQNLRRIYLSAIDARPEIKISAATITWAPSPGSLDDWYNRSGAYQHVFQDWRGWMEEGILDLNIPMAYFREEGHSHHWTRWITFAKDHRYDRHVAMGPGIWLNTIEDTIKQMRDTRDPSPAGNYGQGLFGYSYQGTNNEGLPRSVLLNALTEPSEYDPISPPLFADPAAIPEMPWKTDPQTGHLKGFVQSASNELVADGGTVHLSGPVERTIRVDATGFYGFVAVPPGEYSVTASWDRLSEPVSAGGVSISKGNVTRQDLVFDEAVPWIHSDPEDRDATEGMEVVFEADASGAPEPSFQWQRDGEDIEGAESSRLVLDPVELTDAGEYTVTVYNSAGSVTSGVFTLSVEPLPPPPQLAEIERDPEEGIAAKVLGNPDSWVLIETSMDLVSWQPLTTRKIEETPPSFHDPDWTSFQRRFYHPREIPVHLLIDFEQLDRDEPAMFRNPSFSGSTNEHIATGEDLPDFTVVTGDFPAGIDASQVLHASWSFAPNATEPWLRLTTYNAANIANPTVDFSGGLRFKVYADRPIYLALGLRETDATAAIGGNGGTAGDIEWVGGRTDHDPVPPKGKLIPAGEWTTVHFFFPFEPVRAHTGNGILESETGKGVFENLTIVPADGTGAYNLYVDGLRVLEL